MDFQLSEEQQMMREMAHRFAEERVKPGAAERDRNHEFPVDLLKECAEFHGCGCPGGVGWCRDGLHFVRHHDGRGIPGMCVNRGDSVGEQFAGVRSAA